MVVRGGREVGGGERGTTAAAAGTKTTNCAIYVRKRGVFRLPVSLSGVLHAHL